MFMTAEQAAKQLGVTVATVRSAAKAGKLPGSRRIGGRWFVHTETLAKYFESTLPEIPKTGAEA